MLALLTTPQLYYHCLLLLGLVRLSILTVSGDAVLDALKLLVY
ncbi:hypothetical protein imdm_973 [gamma proteobacterium IMCC2047]|nr:hypothetical protein imdm_973 [gamma proteobacterium IMCC2047]